MTLKDEVGQAANTLSFAPPWCAPWHLPRVVAYLVVSSIEASLAPRPMFRLFSALLGRNASYIVHSITEGKFASADVELSRTFPHSMNPHPIPFTVDHLLRLVWLIQTAMRDREKGDCVNCQLRSRPTSVWQFFPNQHLLEIVGLWFRFSNRTEWTSEGKIIIHLHQSNSSVSYTTPRRHRAERRRAVA